MKLLSAPEKRGRTKKEMGESKGKKERPMFIDELLLCSISYVYSLQSSTNGDYCPILQWGDRLIQVK
jgi:hypothetical protein